MHRTIMALGLAAALLAGTSSLAAQPGLSDTGIHVRGAEEERAPVAAKYPVWQGGSALQRARVNSAVEAEISRFYEEVKRKNEIAPAEGWVGWQIGYEGSDAVSLVLFESIYYKGAAHPTTYVVGMTFDSKGYRIARPEALKKVPAQSAEAINGIIREEAGKRQIMLFPDTFGQAKAWPKEFYIGADGEIYFIFQQYEIAPYAAGWIAIPAGQYK